MHVSPVAMLEVFTTVLTKVQVFWILKSCWLVNSFRCLWLFGSKRSDIMLLKTSLNTSIYQSTKYSRRLESLGAAFNNWGEISHETNYLSGTETFLKNVLPQSHKNYLNLYRTGSSITAFTRARHLSLIWATSTTSNLIFWRSISVLSSHLCQLLPRGLFRSVSASKPRVQLFFPPCMPHVTPILLLYSRRNTVLLTLCFQKKIIYTIVNVLYIHTYIYIYIYIYIYTHTHTHTDDRKHVTMAPHLAAWAKSGWTLGWCRAATAVLWQRSCESCVEGGIKEINGFSQWGKSAERMRLEDCINNVQRKACVDLQWVNFTVLSLLLLLFIVYIPA